MRLTDTDLLAELAKPEYAAIRDAFVSRTYTRGRQVFSPHEPQNSLFIVIRGRARVYLAYRDKEFTMAILDAGDVYTTHTRAYVEALDDLELLVADTGLVRRHLAVMPSLATAMVKVLGELLTHAFGVIDGLAFHDVRKRLLNLLLYEAERAGGQADTRTNTPSIDHGLSVEQLATIVGSTRQTVSSLLNALERDGIIELRGKGIIRIPDLDRLRQLATA